MPRPHIFDISKYLWIHCDYKANSIEEFGSPSEAKLWPPRSKFCSVFESICMNSFISTYLRIFWGQVELDCLRVFICYVKKGNFSPPPSYSSIVIRARPSLPPDDVITPPPTPLFRRNILSSQIQIWMYNLRLIVYFSGYQTKIGFYKANSKGAVKHFNCIKWSK